MYGFWYDEDGGLLGDVMGGSYIGAVYIPINPIRHRDYVSAPMPFGTDDDAAYADRVYPIAMAALRALSSGRSAMQAACHACPSGEVGLLLGDALFALDQEVCGTITAALQILRDGRV